MTGHDVESTLVLDALKDGFGAVRMSAPVEQIVAAGQTRRRRHRVGKATAAAAIAAVMGFGVSAYDTTTTHRAPISSTATPGPVHVRTASFVLDTQVDGTVTVAWNKQAYFQDPAGLQDALRKAGFPVLVKVGEFCKGPDDDGYLSPGGQGRGVDRVLKASQGETDVVLTFVPAAMPPGTELFIGYLSRAQLDVTHGAPGSVERLVPIEGSLTCTTQAPPPHTGRG